MSHNLDIYNLLKESHEHLKRGEFGATIVAAKTAVDDFDVDDIEARLQGLQYLFLACKEIGQLFFAEEYRRYYYQLVKPSRQSQITFPDLGQSAETDMAHEVVRCICRDLHQLGIPILPSLDLLTYAWTDLDGSDSVRAIYYKLPLPVLLDGVGRPVALVVCHDLSLGQNAIEQFQLATRGIVFLDEVEFAPVAGNASERFGVVVRLPKQVIPSFIATGHRILENGLELRDIPFASSTQSPPELRRWANRMALLEAHLLALPLYRAASSGFAAEGDAEAHLETEIQRAGSIAALGDEDEAERIVLSCKEDAEEYGIDTIKGLVDQILAKTHGESAGSGGPFVFDPSTGKVIGGALPEDAEHEWHASKVLTEAWEQEYPEIETPFGGIYAVTHFEYDVPIKGTDQSRRMTLAKIMRAFNGPRIDNVDLKNFASESPATFLTTFCTAIFRALFIVHKRLNGTLSSPTGSALSKGNITPQPKICDYETVLLPALGAPPRTMDQTAIDLMLALEVILSITKELGVEESLTDVLLNCFELYGVAKLQQQEVESIIQSPYHLDGDSESARKLAEYLLASTRC